MSALTRGKSWNSTDKEKLVNSHVGELSWKPWMIVKTSYSAASLQFGFDQSDFFLGEVANTVTLAFGGRGRSIVSLRLAWVTC
jgi:hypothetical protein